MGMLEELDAIIEEAPLDFLGTGDSTRWADKCEREWRERVARFRKRLAELIEATAKN